MASKEFIAGAIKFSLYSTAAVLGTATALAGGAPAGAAAGGAIAGAAAFSGGALLGQISGKVATTSLGMLIHRNLEGFADAIGERLDDTDLPLNHDLLRAMRASHLDALEYVSCRCRENEWDRGYLSLRSGEVKDFLNALDRWIADERLELRRDSYFDRMEVVRSVRQAMTEIRQLPPDANEKANDQPGATLAETSDRSSDTEVQLSHLPVEIHDAVKHAWEELNTIDKRTNVPDRFKIWFDGEAEPVEGQRFASWAMAAHAFFVERLKTDVRVRTVVESMRFAEILSRFDDWDARMKRVIEQTDKLTSIATEIEEVASSIRQVVPDLENQLSQIADRLSNIENRVGGLSTEVASEVIDELLSAAVIGQFSDAVVRELAIIFGGNVKYRQVSRLTRARMKSLRQEFFGRTSELEELNLFVEDNRRGVLVVTAPPGTGKSALLATWCQQRQDKGDLIAHHFISSSDLETPDPVNIWGHLVSQLHQMSLVPGGSRAEPTADRNSVYNQLEESVLEAHEGSYLSEVSRKIVVIDALDEAWENLQPFLDTSSLGDGCFIVVSARAEPNEEPPYIRGWLPQRGRPTPYPREQFNLGPLSEDDFNHWCQTRLGTLSEKELGRVTSEIAQATDRIPLFVGFVLEDLEFSLSQVATQQERLQIVSEIPNSFVTYLGGHIEDLALAGKWSEVSFNLFSILSFVIGPISTKDLSSFAKANDIALPDLESPPWELTRWLNRQGSTLLFSHPRLAATFLSVLRRRNAVQFDEHEAKFINWLNDAWKPELGGVIREPGSEYALEWFPEHLFRRAIAVSDAQLFELCGRLLADTDFLLERVKDPVRAGERLVRHIGVWSKLPTQILKLEWAAEMNAFWVENSSALSSISRKETAPVPSIHSLLAKSLAVSGFGQPIANSRPTNSFSSRQKNSNVIRVHRRAHHGPIYGLLKTGKGYATWGRDGGVKFWTQNGIIDESKGHPAAHNEVVLGVKALHGNYVSWARDGSVACWTGEFQLDETVKFEFSEKLGTKPRRVMDELIKNLLPTKSGFLSWGSFGNIRVWRSDGTLLPNRSHDGVHSQEMRGMLSFNEGFLSWGRKGDILFWNSEGQPNEAKRYNHAHRYGAAGAKEIAGSIVSWGERGSVKFWSRDGDCFSEAGSDDFHRGPIVKWMQCEGQLVSLGKFGELAFWKPNGKLDERRSCKGLNLGSVIGACPFGDGFVIWTETGAILAYDWSGRRKDKMFSRFAHVLEVTGTAPIDSRLISWGNDGGVYFWDSNGQRVAGAGSGSAHLGPVRSVVRFGEGYVSLGGDGEINFWKGDGRKDDSLGAAGIHTGPILGSTVLDDDLITWDVDGTIVRWAPAPLGQKRAVSNNLELGNSVNSDEPELLAEGLGDPKLLLYHAESEGFLRTPAGFVSWDTKQQIRFWTRDGCEVAGAGSRHAHRRWVRGLSRVGEWIVSWGGVGGLKVWTLSGELLGDFWDKSAHWPWVNGVAPTRNGFVSWDQGGQLVSWSIKEKAVERDWSIDAHSYGVLGVRKFDTELVTWGGDGAVRRWDLEGKQNLRFGGHLHDSLVGGVRRCQGGFVSWGHDGRVRFLDINGRLVKGAGGQAHDGRVSGLITHSNGLVSWGTDGSIAFWSSGGQLINEGHTWPAHLPAGISENVSGVKKVGDRFVSWGADGQVIFWSPNGRIIPAIDKFSHKGPVKGVQRLKNGLLSWSEDGSVMYWNSEGLPCPNEPAVTAIPEGVNAVFRLADCLGLFGFLNEIVLIDREGKIAAYSVIPGARTTKSVRSYGSELALFGNSLELVNREYIAS